MKHQAKPILTADINHALDLMQKYPNGLTRNDLGRLFSSERRGREVMEHVTAAGIAPIINVKGTYTEERVYRLAQTRDEVQAYAHYLSSYQESLERRREGLWKAWERGSVQRQQVGIFDAA